MRVRAESATAATVGPAWLASAFGGLGLSVAIAGGGFLVLGYRSRIGAQK